MKAHSPYLQRSLRKLLQRLLPRPVLSAALLLIGLAFANNVTVSQGLLAALLAWAMPLLMQKLVANNLLSPNFLLPAPRVAKPLLLLRFGLIVSWDIAVANCQVAALILQSNRRLRPAFIEMPLSVRDEFVIALLMSVITLTPGTLAAQLSDDRRRLLIHALHTDNPTALIAQLQRRYEQPLREIYAC